MPYPDDLVQEGETLALDLRPHWWYFSRNILTGIPLFIVLILVFQLDSGTFKNVSNWVVGLVLLAWAAWLLLKYFQWRMTYFVVTSRRVIYRTGVISKHGVEITLERINNINFHQRIIDRIIGAGDLDIESAGKDGQSHFDDVWHPDAVQQELYRQMEANAKKRAGWANPPPAAAAAPVQAPPPAPPSVPEQLQQLADLRDRGVITAEEFEMKKAQLLERM
jgi:uncharacterized membrane protein YdbT with pleckstrin-like domain